MKLYSSLCFFIESILGSGEEFIEFNSDIDFTKERAGITCETDFTIFPDGYSAIPASSSDEVRLISPLFLYAAIGGAEVDTTLPPFFMAEPFRR